VVLPEPVKLHSGDPTSVDGLVAAGEKACNRARRHARPRAL